MEQEFAREQRWNYLVEEYQTMLYRVAFANMKNRADAEDVVQEAFLRYMKDEKPILNKEHEKAWLIRTTIHICNGAFGGISDGGIQRGLSALPDQG